MAALTLNVQGKTVNAAMINGFARRVGSLDDVLSVWANAATLQVAVHGNRNWIDQLFNMPTLQLKNGDLNKLGKEVLAYIQAHCPRIVWNKDNRTIGLTKLVKESILATHFVAVGATEESETVSLHRNKFYQLHGDFALTFSEFKNLASEKAEPEEKEVSMTAKAFITQATKALECFKAERLVGTPDELFAAAAHAKALFMALDAAHTKSMEAKLVAMQESGAGHTLADEFDTARIDMSNGTISNKSRQAPGPVGLAEAIEAKAEVAA